MKKLLVVGGSIVAPEYFSVRLRNEKTHDLYNFVQLCAELGEFDSVKELSINGAGNAWTSGAVLNALDWVDADTTVIVQWQPIDRWDMFLHGAMSNDCLEFKEKSLLPGHLQGDEVFFNTFDFESNIAHTGYRAWITGPFFLGVKAKYGKEFFDYVTAAKNFLEHMALAQRLIKERGARQMHMLPWDPFTRFERQLMKYIRNTYVDPSRYVQVTPPPPTHNLLDANPFLQKWLNFIDWSCVTEHHMDFFVRNELPFWCARLDHGFHQLPLNNYILVKSMFFPQASGRLLTEVIDESKRHSKEQNIHFDTEHPSVLRVLQTLEQS